MNTKKKIKTSLWALKIAWKIGERKLLGWGILSLVLAMLPSVSIKIYQRIVADISRFIDIQTGSYEEISMKIVFFGIILLLIGLSGRINGDLLYMVMYDSYYLGMQELMMDTIQKIDIEDIRKKEIKDEYNAIIVRAGSLTDFISSICMLISRSFGTLLLLGVTFTYSKPLFIFAVVYVGFVCVVNYRSSEKNRGKIKKIRDAERRVKQIEDIPSKTSIAKEIRVFSAKDRILDFWDRAYDEIDKQKKEQNFQREKDSYILGAGFYVFNIGVLAYTAYHVCTGHISADIFLVLYSLCQSLSLYISDITKSYLDSNYGLYSLERQMEFMEMVESSCTIIEDNKENSVTQDKKKQCPAIQLDNVSYAYGDNEPVLHDINITIPKGEVVALVGYNGCGKTTLTKLLLGLYHPKEGNIYLNGYEYSTISTKYINSKIGVFFQNFSLFHASLRENVGFGDIDHIEQNALIWEALKKGGADGIAESMSDGMESWLFRNVKPDGYELSGGQKQKIAVSRAYMNNKEILIFDEPAASLDPIAEMKQFKEIRDHLQGKTAILISHRIGFARMADRIIVLNEGAVAEQGTHEELMMQNGLYYKFYTQQAELYHMDSSESFLYTLNRSGN